MRPFRLLRTGDVDVLLVEDDPALAEMYRLGLVAEGYGVRVASDGPSGLQAALGQPPDLLLLDLRLPGLSGFELLARLRETRDGADIPVIVLSNYGELEVVSHGMALGVAEHLIKSETTPDRLVYVIRHLLTVVPTPPPVAG